MVAADSPTSRGSRRSRDRRGWQIADRILCLGSAEREEMTMSHVGLTSKLGVYVIAPGPEDRRACESSRLSGGASGGRRRRLSFSGSGAGASTREPGDSLGSRESSLGPMPVRSSPSQDRDRTFLQSSRASWSPAARSSSFRASPVASSLCCSSSTMPVSSRARQRVGALRPRDVGVRPSGFRDARRGSLRLGAVVSGTTPAVSTFAGGAPPRAGRTRDLEVPRAVRLASPRRGLPRRGSRAGGNA